MNERNGAPILLPGAEAHARQQQAIAATMRLQVAAGIVGQLLPQQLAAQVDRARKAAGASDGPVAFQAGEEGGAIDNATNLAIATADMLLEKLGL